MNKSFINVYSPHVAKNQKEYILKCYNDNMYSFRGEFVTKFEEALKNYLGVRNVITTFNGSVSLALMLSCLGIGPGDEVITQSLTYAATVSQVNILNAKAMLVDCDQVLQIDIDKLWKSFTRKTKAVMVAELYSDIPDLDKIKDICQQKKVPLLEDSAEAFACKYNNKFAGTWGIAGSFSFFSNKVIHMGGEGGCVVTDNDEFADKMRLFRSQGHLGNFVHIPGSNFRATNIQAAIGLSQLEDLKEILKKKRRIAEFYRKNLSWKIIRIVPFNNVVSAEWMPLFELPDTLVYPRFSEECMKAGIEVRPAFTPIHLMNGFDWTNKQSLKNSERVYKNKFNLPSGPDLTDEQLNYIVETVNSIVKVY